MSLPQRGGLSLFAVVVIAVGLCMTAFGAASTYALTQFIWNGRFPASGRVKAPVEWAHEPVAFVLLALTFVLLAGAMLWAGVKLILLARDVATRRI